jgi:hypothetical protein
VTDTEECRIAVRKKGCKRAQSTRAKHSRKAPKAALQQRRSVVKKIFESYDENIKHRIYLCQIIINVISESESKSCHGDD